MADVVHMNADDDIRRIIIETDYIIPVYNEDSNVWHCERITRLYHYEDDLLVDITEVK